MSVFFDGIISKQAADWNTIGSLLVQGAQLAELLTLYNVYVKIGTV